MEVDGHNEKAPLVPGDGGVAEAPRRMHRQAAGIVLVGVIGFAVVFGGLYVAVRAAPGGEVEGAAALAAAGGFQDDILPCRKTTGDDDNGCIDWSDDDQWPVNDEATLKPVSHATPLPTTSARPTLPNPEVDDDDAATPTPTPAPSAAPAAARSKTLRRKN
jgi:hypothetical protein